MPKGGTVIELSLMNTYSTCGYKPISMESQCLACPVLMLAAAPHAALKDVPALHKLVLPVAEEAAKAATWRSFLHRNAEKKQSAQSFERKGKEGKKHFERNL